MKQKNTKKMKRTIIIALLALIAVDGQAKTFKTIKSPVAMGHNIYGGEFKAREVVMTDTATTVHFTIEYPKGEKFSINSTSYLMDEDGNRYPLRSAEGIKLNKYGESTGSKDFTLHFEPMPKQVKMFDYIEGDGSGAFMLLGIRDKKTKLKAPTLQKLSKASPYIVPDDWFKTDTITIQGRIEGYDASTFGFTSMECFTEDVFEPGGGTMVLDIAPDGTFCKKFQANYPMHESFFTDDSKVGFEEIPFFARPGETIDITVRKGDEGKWECLYNSGSSKDVVRLLKSKLLATKITHQLGRFKGTCAEAIKKAEEIWPYVMYRLQVEGKRFGFTPLEMQLALADVQTLFAEAFMSFAMYHEMDTYKDEERDGEYHRNIVDLEEYNALYDMKTYTILHRIDFDNPLLFQNDVFRFALNRIRYARPVMERKYDFNLSEDGSIAYESSVSKEKKALQNYVAALRDLMGDDKNNLMIQLCAYHDIVDQFRLRNNEKDSLALILSSQLDAFANPFFRQKAEKYCAAKMAETDIATPLPEDNPSAEIIRQLCAKYPGRILMIDFWGMGCGPCRGAIQSSKEKRAEIAKRNDVKLVFIAGERTAEGSDAYHKYVNEWLANEETICVTNTEFNRLQELFRFNGIPHYETITPDCRRVRDDFRIDGYYNFDRNLQRLLEKLK